MKDKIVSTKYGKLHVHYGPCYFYLHIDCPKAAAYCTSHPANSLRMIGMRNGCKSSGKNSCAAERSQ